MPPHLESGGGSHNISCSSDSTQTLDQAAQHQPNISTASAQHQHSISTTSAAPLIQPKLWTKQPTMHATTNNLSTQPPRDRQDQDPYPKPAQVAHPHSATYHSSCFYLFPSLTPVHIPAVARRHQVSKDPNVQTCRWENALEIWKESSGKFLNLEKKTPEIGRNRLCRPQLHLLFWPFGPGQELAAVSLRNSRRFGLLTEIRRILTFCGEEESLRGCGLALIRCTALNILMCLSQQIRAAAMKNYHQLGRITFRGRCDGSISLMCVSAVLVLLKHCVCAAGRASLRDHNEAKERSPSKLPVLQTSLSLSWRFRTKLMQCENIAS